MAWAAVAAVVVSAGLGAYGAKTASDAKDNAKKAQDKALAAAVREQGLADGTLVVTAQNNLEKLKSSQATAKGANAAAVAAQITAAEKNLKLLKQQTDAVQAAARNANGGVPAEKKMSDINNDVPTSKKPATAAKDNSTLLLGVGACALVFIATQKGKHGS